MASASSYLKYLPAVLSSAEDANGAVTLGKMLCVFEKILTGIDDGVPIAHGDGSVLTLVTQTVTGNVLPQTVHVTAGSGMKFGVGSSYTYEGAIPEVINIAARTANTVTAVIRQNHPANQAIVNSTGSRRPIQDVIADLITHYGAWTTPGAYLDWLGQWVALQFAPTWDDYQRRSALSRIVGVYANRGTKQGLDTYFDLYATSRQPTRLVVDNASKILFCRPQAAGTAPVWTLVSQLPVVAPQCLAIDQSGHLLVGDLGSGLNNPAVAPALWRISRAGHYDHNPGPPGLPQPYQPAGVQITGPVAVAADALGGAYLIDRNAAAGLQLFRFAAPQSGTVSLSGGPARASDIGTFVIGGSVYAFPETDGATAVQQAAAWTAALNAAMPFKSRYVATNADSVITISPRAGTPPEGFTCFTISSPAPPAPLKASTSGPRFGTSVVFGNASQVNLQYPTAMVVNAAGHPIILDRGIAPQGGTTAVTAIADVQTTGSPPTFSGTVRHALGTIVEPLSMLLRADGSLIVGDGGNQYSATPADLMAIDTNTWTASSLLADVAAGDNPLIAPVGIVEVDAKHLMVLDAGLRPYYVPATRPFNLLVARQAAIYSVDLSVVPPRIICVSEPKALVYPRGMVGDGAGTLYICDSGMPSLSNFDSLGWRWLAQQFSVLAHFQGDPKGAVYCVALSGTPNTGRLCAIAIGAVTHVLAEASGNTLAQQATAWAQALNGNQDFNAAYTALAVANLIFVCANAGPPAAGLTISTTSSADVTLTGGLLSLAATLTPAGAPASGEQVIINLGGSSYPLPVTAGQSAAQLAAAWAVTLNATAAVNAYYVAAAADATLLIFHKAPNIGERFPPFINGSTHMALTVTWPPAALGTVTLLGTPTSGESCSITVGPLPPLPLPETSGLSIEQQAQAWSDSLNATAAFNHFSSQLAFVANSVGGVLTIFAMGTANQGSATLGLSATSSAHLRLTIYSALQDHNQFLQSIRDVVTDQIPADASWNLLSQT